MTTKTTIPDYESIPDSRPISAPTVDERIRDLEVVYDARSREMRDFQDRLRAIEAWPQRIVATVAAGALGMMATVAGSAWYLGSRLTATEASVDALTVRAGRVETAVDRWEDRAWERAGRTAHHDGGE